MAFGKVEDGREERKGKRRKEGDFIDVAEINKEPLNSLGTHTYCTLHIFPPSAKTEKAKEEEEKNKHLTKKKEERKEQGTPN